jgi:hypothetical protein
METFMKNLATLLLIAGTLPAGTASQRTFTGVVTDSMCGRNHAMMKVTPDSKCVTECVKAGTKYALFDGKNVYTLSDQKTPEQFAGQKVRISGTLYEKTKILKVDSISADGQPSAMPTSSSPHNQH